MARRIVERDVRVTVCDVEEFCAINPRLFRRDEQVRARSCWRCPPMPGSPNKR